LKLTVTQHCNVSVTYTYIYHSQIRLIVQCIQYAPYVSLGSNTRNNNS